jgi:hypothetical protein
MDTIKISKLCVIFGFLVLLFIGLTSDGIQRVDIDLSPTWT